MFGVNTFELNGPGVAKNLACNKIQLMFYIF